MSDAPMPFPCKDVGSPDKEQRQKLQQLVGITGNNAETLAVIPYTAPLPLSDGDNGERRSQARTVTYLLYHFINPLFYG